MPSNFGKIFAFLLLCGLWTFGAANICAQGNSQQNPPSRKVLKPEMEGRTIPEAAGVDIPANGTQSIQTIEDGEKIVSEDAKTSKKERTGSADTIQQVSSGNFKHNFTLNGGREMPAASFDDTNYSPPLDDPAKVQNGKAEGFRWRPAIAQSMMFLAIQHGYAFTQPKTRQALKGKFWKDYANSVKSLRGFDDGGRFFTNYIAHPMQGSFTGFIYVQNDPKGLKQQFGTSGKYWSSRLKAFAWSAAWSTQFEIGPVSQASIGNIGLKGKQTWGDIVVTPTVGTAMLVTEDAIDRFIIKRIERSTSNFYIRIFSRMFLSPTRTVANLFRFKEPWYRDRPTGH